MPIRARKFVGTIALLVLVLVWGLLAMALAQSVLTDINGFVAAIYYVIAGLGWIVPAMPLISWMGRPDAAEPVPEGGRHCDTECHNVRRLAEPAFKITPHARGEWDDRIHH